MKQITSDFLLIVFAYVMISNVISLLTILV
jgi:hypothetical protein